MGAGIEGKMIWLLAGLAAIVHVGCMQGVPQGVFRVEDVRMAPDAGRRFVAARVCPGGRVFLAMVERQDSQKVLRLMRSDGQGHIGDVFTLPVEGACSSFRVVARDNESIVGWIDATVETVCLVWESEGELGRRMRLEVPPLRSGRITRFWIVPKQGADYLLVLRVEHESNANDPAEAFTGEHRLYCYGLDGGQPRLVGSTCLDRDVEHVEVEDCGGGEDAFFVWQSVKPQGPGASPERVSRVGRWHGSGEPEWRAVYAGTNPLTIALDYVDGSKSVVHEWKDPESAAGIFCVLSAQNGGPIPVATDAPYSSQNRVWAKLLGTPCRWALGFRQRQTNMIVVRVFDHALRLEGIAQINGAGIVDYRLLGKGDDLYLVSLGAEDLKVRRLSLTRPIHVHYAELHEPRR